MKTKLLGCLDATAMPAAIVVASPVNARSGFGGGGMQFRRRLLGLTPAMIMVTRIYS